MWQDHSVAIAYPIGIVLRVFTVRRQLSIVVEVDIDRGSDDRTLALGRDVCILTSSGQSIVHYVVGCCEGELSVTAEERKD